MLGRVHVHVQVTSSMTFPSFIWSTFDQYFQNLRQLYFYKTTDRLPPPTPIPQKRKQCTCTDRGGGSEFGRGVPIHFLKNSDFLITTCHSHGKVVENTGKPWTPLANKITSPSGKKILAPRMIPRDRYPVDTAVMLPVF